MIDSSAERIRDGLLPYEDTIGSEPEHRSLIDFTKSTFPRYSASWHHELIADRLERIERGELTRLVITMPPRHGKSELASVNFPAWFLGRNPDSRVIACSNTARLANRFSRLARNKVSHYRWAFPKVRLADDQANIESWDLQGFRGGYIAAGIGGQVTGFGADLILVDDPVKSAAQADSDTYRETTWEWYTETLRTRLEPGGAIVVIGTRWHEDDLIGRLLQQDEDAWEVINLPAIADDGAPLWPSRWPLDELEKVRRNVGTRAWQAQYQGAPAPLEGGILKRHWFGHYDMPGHYTGIIQAWDTAFKTGEQHDTSACVTIGLYGARIDVLDVFQARLEFPELERAVQDQHLVWSARYPAIPITVLVEDKGSGQSLIQSARKWPHANITMIPVPSSRPNEKVQRVSEIAPAVEAGRVRVPADAHWLDAVMHEWTTFPFARHDDAADALAIAVRRAVGIGATASPARDESAFAPVQESRQSRRQRYRRNAR